MQAAGLSNGIHLRDNPAHKSGSIPTKKRLNSAWPNPSFEPTRSGRPLQAFISFSALLALPPRAAQLKR